VRELIMATVSPVNINFPADEAVARPGLDGVLTVVGDAGPFIPSGNSVWEASTNGDPKTKATSDYKKRTQDTSPEDRGNSTFVFVTSRSWPGWEAWLKETQALADGWKDIRVFEAETLALWLNTCPGVEAWLAGHLNHPYGVVGLQRWFDGWSTFTEPATPAALLVAGRRTDVIHLLNALDGPPRVHELSGGSTQEVVAFVAAALTLGPGPDPQAPKTSDPPVRPPYADEADSIIDTDPVVLARPRSDAELEALLARAVVVKSQADWDRWANHDHPQLLIPTFYPDNIDAATAAGHHVILPRTAQDTNDIGRLTPISVDAARAAWGDAGVDFKFSDEYARASRRNLLSLRRRIARHRRHRTPEWATGPSAPLLAAALLAGGWNTNAEGDVEVILALTERATLRSLNRDLAPLTRGDDPALVEIDKVWKFVEPLDAWEALAGNLAAEDLELFMEQVTPVLTEIDPARDLTNTERLTASLRNAPQRRRHSRTLREGLATTLALLGATVEDTRIAGNLTGANVANIVVRDLLADADADRWLTLSGLLPRLAEASPDMFLDAVERSLRQPNPPVMALFGERDDGFGMQRSDHSPLLWALETLAFSEKHLSRVAVVLAKLTELDPGGRLANRPLDSLMSMLHLALPQGAINGANRIAIVDAVRRASPALAPRVLAKLITGVNRGMVIRTGPRYRAWPTPRTRSTNVELVDAVNELTERLLEDTIAVGHSDSWSQVARIIGHITPSGQTKAIDSLVSNWNSIDPDNQAELTKGLSEIAERHRRHPGAHWSMPSGALEALDAFLAEHGTVVEQASDLFGWWPRSLDMSTPEGREQVQRRRIEAMAALAEGGIAPVLNLVGASAAPYSVGYALGQATAALDEAALDLLGGDDVNVRQFVAGLIGARVQEEGWLTKALAERAEQAAAILVELEANDEHLDLVDGFSEDQREQYWATVDSHRATDEATERFVVGLLAAGRAFSAIDAVGSIREGKAPTATIVAVLQAVLLDSNIENVQVLRSPQHTVGTLLDQLEDDGLPNDQLADLEWLYLPLLNEERSPRALHQRLADDPAFFAEVASHMYTPDPPESDQEVPEDEYQFIGACWDLIRGWSSPLPGATAGIEPDSETMQAWVSQARQELVQRNRAGIASGAIGAALGGRTTDAGDIWPCRAVREVLEHEQDDDLEDELAITRVNGRGVSTRGSYDGGRKERKLADKYRAAAADLRDEWPRTGKVLDRIVAIYESHARREDNTAERRVQE